MEHLFSNRMPGSVGEVVVRLTCLPCRAAAGNSMPENRQTRSSPKKPVSCLYRAWSVAFASKIHTNLFFAARRQTFPSHLLSMCLDGKSCLILPPNPSLRHFSVSPLILVLPAKGVKPRVPCVVLSKSRVPEANSTHGKGGERCSQPLKDTGRRDSTKTSSHTC